MKRKSWRKVVSVGLAAAMAAGMLTGCGKGKEESKVEINPVGTYPIVKEGTMELKVFTMSMPNVEDFATNDFSKYMEEKTGIKVEYITAGRDDWEEKLNMLMQSDDYPDVILGVNPNIAKYGVKEEIFIPLDEYLTEENVPNYLKTMEEYDINITKETDGKIYSMADMNDCYHCSYGRKMWVNTYYLDQIGCEIPTTAEEFVEVCEKFLAYKPDGVAVAGAQVGWFSRMQDWLMGGFTFVPGKSSTFNVRDYIALDSESGKMVETATTDEYKEGLKFIKQLYDMGAIYEGDFTQTGEQMKTLVNQADEPVLFFTAGTISDAIDSAGNNELYRKYQCMGPIAGPDGTQIAWTAAPSASSGAVCITDKCENVEAALRWADVFYSSPIGDLSSQFGAEEGKDWVLNPEGEVGLNGEPALYKVLNQYSAETQNHDWQDVGIRVATAEYRLGMAVDADVDPYSPDGLEQLLFNTSKELYEPFAQNTTLVNLDQLKVTDEESTNVSTIGVEIEKCIEENSVAFMTGAKDIDKEWDNYLKAMDKAGLKTLLDTYQTAYDRMYKK